MLLLYKRKIEDFDLYLLIFFLVYVDASADCNDLVFYLGDTSASYNIRITQYNCEYENLAPRGCTEYLFGEQTGFIYSYNWDGGK